MKNIFDMKSIKPYLIWDRNGWVGHIHPDIDEKKLRYLLDNLDTIQSTYTPFWKDVARTRLLYDLKPEDEIHDSGPQILKINYPPRRHRIWNRLIGSYAAFGFRNSCEIAINGFPYITHYAVLEKKENGALVQSVMIFQKIQPFTFGGTYLLCGFEKKEHIDPPATRLPRIKQFATIVSEMHQRGIFHLDLGNYNILVADQENTPCFYFIDLDYMTVTHRQSGFIYKLFQLFDLLIMNVMFRNDLYLRDKLRFLSFYFNEPVRKIPFINQIRWVIDHREQFRSQWFFRIMQLTRKLAYLFHLVKHPQIPVVARDQKKNEA
ncbi:MAG: hypothetical protein B6244_06930 [Candidatus Cloacimonetes bacterium 4572_55]|nr:MAG: hypothetical protein B6244_06930 [Candidatus Cloacimonetes bacterium 4572_55]